MADATIDLDAIGSVIVVGVGKATAAMATAVETLMGDRISEGVIAIPYGHREPLVRIRQMEAGHPIPDENGIAAARSVLEAVRLAKERDVVICLLSGGGSALMPLPAEGIRLSDKQETSRLLIQCGASIHEINTVRKHLSAIKGGRLAQAAFPARMFTWIVSDVVGDDLDVIASGPTVADPSTYGDARRIVERHDLLDKLPRAVVERIDAGCKGLVPETPKPGEPWFERIQTRILASNIEALLAAQAEAQERGYHTMILSSRFSGDTGALAAFHLAVLHEMVSSGNPIGLPACILSGGETTVVVRGEGLGGRNQEFVLHAVGRLPEDRPAVCFSAGTDGRDGPTDAAGALADSTSLERARQLGLDPEAYLRNNDSYTFFSRLGDGVITGKTGTNVMDIRLILVR
ncbi:MAG: glycerate kinase [Thermodesulfobacteriota bacterium]